jgi:hypothetical protein
MKVILLTGLILSGCGPLSPTIKTESTASTKHKADAEINTYSTLDRILEICEVLKEGRVVPYSQWTPAQHKCIAALQLGGLDNGNINN